jgi:hypothetical protein
LLAGSDFPFLNSRYGRMYVFRPVAHIGPYC